MTTLVHWTLDRGYRRHGQLSRLWITNLSCDRFNQLCSAADKIAAAMLFPHTAFKFSECKKE